MEPQPDDTIFGESTPLAKHHRTLEMVGNGFLPRYLTPDPDDDKQRTTA
ncbi:MAG: hypothetical protein ABIG63_22015 [Chloroflexota bacterium]